MNHKNLLTQFFKPIKSISELIKVSNNKGIIIGGIASSILGKPRFTADIDVNCWVAIKLFSFKNIIELLLII